MKKYILIVVVLFSSCITVNHYCKHDKKNNSFPEDHYWIYNDTGRDSIIYYEMELKNIFKNEK